MHTAWELYCRFWMHNMGPALFIHLMVVFCIAGAIDGLTYERRMFNLRTHEDQRNYPENTGPRDH